MQHRATHYPRIFLAFAVTASLLLGPGASHPAFADDTPGVIQERIYLPNIAAQDPAVADATPQDLAQPIPDSSAVGAASVTYYVDCAAGNDAKSGLSPADAWQTLTTANKAALPGDQLLLKRGCTFPGPLEARWQGTASQPILISTYGEGELPIIQDAYAVNVKVTGSYQTIEDLHATQSSPPNPDPNCQNQPVAWKVGFQFFNGAAYNTISNSKATKNAIGIYFMINSHHNKALGNSLVDNNVVWQMNQTDALGAMGILLHGDSQEVAHNYFANNKTICTYTNDDEHISIELYTAKNSLIHHNISYDRNFSELGSSSTFRSANNTFAYNLHIASDYGSRHGGRFIITRGWGQQFGPVLNTQVLHNDVYITGDDGKGVACQFCSAEILTMKNNILWVDPEPFSSDMPFAESHNIFWSTDGTPLLNWRGGMTMSATSRKVNPMFADPTNGQFNLVAGSPARDQGTLEFVPTAIAYDLAQSAVPLGPQADIGGYEFNPDPWMVAATLPGRIEAENYRVGGEGSGYHDTTAGNTSGAYRNNDVDIQVTQDSSGAYHVGWLAAGEWLAYDIDVSMAGTYNLVARVAASSGGRLFHIEIDGVKVTGSVKINATGGMQVWADVPVAIPLTAGEHILRFVAETNGFNLNYLTVE